MNESYTSHSSSFAYFEARFIYFGNELKIKVTETESDTHSTILRIFSA